MVFIDTGNDESDVVWLRFIEQADAIVVPAINKREHAEAAKELLQGLREGGRHATQLADNAVIIISHGERDGIDPETFVPLFQQLARSVVTIPYDPAVGADWLRYDNLQQATQRAWLRAAAATAECLTTAPEPGHECHLPVRWVYASGPAKPDSTPGVSSLVCKVPNPS